MSAIRKQVAAAIPEAPVARLRWRCDPDSLPFMTTDEVEPRAGIIGQERARKALVLGMAIDRAGYNIYVCGEAGTGKLAAVREIAEQLQNRDAQPPDLCYVSGFKNPERPRLLELPAGQGARLKEAMHNLTEDLREDVPKVLAGAKCQRRKARCLDRYQRREQRLVAQLESRLAPSFGLVWHTLDSSAVPEVAPLVQGRPTPMAELEERVESGGINVARFRELHDRWEALEAASVDILAEMVRLRHQMQEDVRSLEREAARPVIR
ncbi:MAG: AAA family ATPase, partial [Candidatus Tectomicrobia bacterium]|nr:AAA family ATPase [Candidatus Tectomicrobia bacterium]